MSIFERARQRLEGSADQSAPPPSTLTPGSMEALDAAVNGLVVKLRGYSGRVPNRALVLARSIAHALDDVVESPAANLTDVQTRITLERMASVHLPETIDAYLGARSAPNADAMLIEQLTTMENVATSVSQRALKAAQDAFAVQGAFLEDKYGAGYA